MDTTTRVRVPVRGLLSTLALVIVVAGGAAACGSQSAHDGTGNAGAGPKPAQVVVPAALSNAGWYPTKQVPDFMP